MQLHRRDVVDKATQLLDDYGIADLTMRRLARELGVTPGALYWHFADKQALLGAVADRILEPAVGTIEHGRWALRIHDLCVRLRNALLSATDGAELVSASFAAGRSERMAEILQRLDAAAAEAGIEPPNADLAARTVLYYVLGFTADEQSRLQWDAAGALSEDQSVMSTNPNARFTFGLALLVDGIAAQYVVRSGDHGIDPGVAVPAS
ncbi:TetR family transcriptional regulator [Mycolicibacterium hodleri]|uniref:TetR family transcriptional regulator n=1 Tax=Mycolicibacterium hodleri TaxID=49897 RepID=A0A502E389_9MYCO|nr:TetR family transcriptional regulator [Mycolicibacterium hodleri]TPG32238.1 TetR family transcriptional regulator [Mycolicibacterium hodleri]